MARADSYCISTPTVVVDGVNLAIVPNSLMFTEGFGEQDVKVQSSGGGQVQPIVTLDVTTSLSRVAMQVVNTAANIQQLRQIKSDSANFHVVSFFDNTVGFIRTVQQAILTSDYEVGLGADTPISIEFKGAPSV